MPPEDEYQRESVPSQGYHHRGSEPPILHGHLPKEQNTSGLGLEGVNVQPQEGSVFGLHAAKDSSQDSIVSSRGSNHSVFGLWCDLCNRRLIELKRQALKLWMPFASHKTTITIEVSEI